jgi:hypothetical protein
MTGCRRAENRVARRFDLHRKSAGASRRLQTGGPRTVLQAITATADWLSKARHAD